jgi:predicted Rossmann fold nucleotide-binding protein DprA/Smf involved in DNA uptake
MGDLVDQTRREIAERQRALEPAVNEYQRLQAALAALDTATHTLRGSQQRTAARSRSSRPVKPRTVKTSGSKTAAPARPKQVGGRRSAPRAKRTLEIIADRPGVTISELASAMGIKATYLYRVLPDLEQAGDVAKRGRGYVARGWDKGGP